MSRDIITLGRTRFLTNPSEVQMLISVNGVGTWREARYEREIATQLCSRRGIETDYDFVLRPVLREGERLLETIDRKMEIVTL